MIQTINISLIPSDNKPVINVSQYDNGLRVLRFNIFDDTLMEVPHVFDSETVTCNIRKNDNNIVVITGTIETETTEEGETSYVQVVLTEQACACVGSNYGEISLSIDDDVIGTCNFKLIVERSPLAGGVNSQTAVDNLTTQIAAITSQIVGENYYDKEEIDGMFDDLDIPTKTSELENDSGFITAEDLPTKTSELENDSGFTTIDDAATVSDKTWSSNKINEELINILPIGTASGSIANFNTALAWPLEIEAEFGAEISGVSAINVTACGKNLFNPANITTGTIENNKWVITGTGGSRKAIDFIFSPNTQYTFSGHEVQAVANKNARLRVVYTDNSVVNIWTDSTIDGLDFSYTTNSSKSVKEVIFDYSASGGSVEISNFQIEIGAAASSYEPFNGSTTLINLGDTYYNGGEVNIDKSGHRTLTADGQTVTLPDGEPINAFVGINNVYCDTGDITVQYKDTIQNYIDTRVNTVSNRSLSMMRTLETLEKSAELERGETDER